MTAQQEALEILSTVTRDLMGSQSTDLKSVLRRCLLICQLLGWEGDFGRFRSEIQGYAPEAPVPQYRVVAAKEVSRTTNLNDAIEVTVREGTGGFDPGAINVRYEIRGNIDFLLSVRTSGFSVPTGATRTFEFERRRVDLIRAIILDSSVIARVIAAIEDAAFEFASSAYRVLRYGDLLTDFWQQYRIEVEESLRRIGLDQHLPTIEQGLSSDNEAGWRAGVLACRSLLEDLAAHLWKDSRPTYDKLPGDGPGGYLAVTADKYVNRISAYLHLQEVTGKGGNFVRGEADRLSNSLRALVSCLARSLKK